MSTEYNITRGLVLTEHSSDVQYTIDAWDHIATSDMLDAEDLRLAIINQIEVLSYISENADEVLKRFNVNYGDLK